MIISKLNIMRILSTTSIFFLLVILATGCNEDAAPTDSMNENQSADRVWVFNNLDGKILEWETTSINELPSDSYVTHNRGNGNSTHTHGDYVWSTLSATYEFSGTENNGGTHGSAYMTLPFPPFETIELTLETECVNVFEGNVAIYGATITESVNDLFGIFAVGNIVYIKVIDNGQGNNADPDQRSPTTIISTFSECGTLSPSDERWDQFGPNEDIQEPGSVKVNN